MIWVSVPRQRLKGAVAGLCIGTALIACSAPAPTPVASPEPAPQTSLDEALSHVAEAFGTEPESRAGAVYTALEGYLRHPDSSGRSDIENARALTGASLQAGTLTVPAPILLERSDHLAVIGLPDGLGIVLYDLTAPAGTPPVALSRWSLGLSTLDVTWGQDELGVLFTTVGRDGMPQAHFVSAARAEAGWVARWDSDEQPDWWINTLGAEVQVAPDLSSVIISGPGYATTDIFLEAGASPHRLIVLTWVRDEGGYHLDPGPGEYPGRRHWFWDVSLSAPYATLVEFMECLVYGDTSGLSDLVTGDRVIQAARDFGLDRQGRRFEVISVDEAGFAMTFRDEQVVLIARFAAPGSEGEKWRIDSLLPPGAPDS